jgi:hypothetical protein
MVLKRKTLLRIRGIIYFDKDNTILEMMIRYES